MDISNIRKAVEGCEEEFLSFVLNHFFVTLENRNSITTFVITDSYYANKIIDEMMETDPSAFVHCVLDFICECKRSGVFEKKDGKENADPT